MKTCESCQKPFDGRVLIKNKIRNLHSRRYCLSCSPFGTKDRRSPEDRSKDEDGCRKCSRCQKRKPLNKKNFIPVKRKFGPQFSTYCRPCESEKGTEWRRKRKIQCVKYKGGRCEICGYDKSINALHFHHKDPKKKELTIGTHCGRNWQIVRKELDKCSLLCANCHAEKHEN
jgi:hypothetical protein